MIYHTASVHPQWAPPTVVVILESLTAIRIGQVSVIFETADDAATWLHSCSDQLEAAVIAERLTP